MAKVDNIFEVALVALLCAAAFALFGPVGVLIVAIMLCMKK